MVPFNVSLINTLIIKFFETLPILVILTLLGSYCHCTLIDDNPKESLLKPLKTPKPQKPLGGYQIGLHTYISNEYIIWLQINHFKTFPILTYYLVH